MAQLEIKGHKTRGKEVIALLEMLGGKNDTVIPYDGSDDTTYYRILKDGSSRIVSSHYILNERGVRYRPYTLEQFEKEFPYKVDDEVRLGVPDEVRIVNAYWDSCSDQVIYEAISVHDGSVYDNLHAKQLSPCKEQTSPDKAKAPALEGQDYSEGRCGYKIPEGFEFDKVENGEIILKPKKKELPKTLEECIGLLNRKEKIEIISLTGSLNRLLFARNAFWKLAGEEMGLGKPWGNDIEDDDDKFFICNVEGELHTGVTFHNNHILAFPTAKMRDAFYESFKGLINECKELLKDD